MDGWWPRHGAATAGAATFAVVIAGPFLAVEAFPSVQVIAENVCPPGQTQRLVRPAWNTVEMEAVPDDAAAYVKAPKVREANLQRDLRVDRIPFMQTVIDQTHALFDDAGLRSDVSGY